MSANNYDPTDGVKLPDAEKVQVRQSDVPDNIEPAQIRQRVRRSSFLLALMVALGILVGYVTGACWVAASRGSAPTLLLIAGLTTVMVASLYAGIHRFLTGALNKILERLGGHTRRFEVTLDNISQGVCFFDSEQRLILANRRYAEIYRLPLSCILPGTTLRQIAVARFAANTSPDMTPEEYMHAREKADALDHPSDTVINLCSGQVISIHHRSMPDRGWIATHEDITVRCHAEEETVFLAHHDPLTGLPNRQRFRTCMMDATAAQREDEHVAVLCLDLDRFKQVNDTFGHSAGDAVLCAVADRLVGCVRKSDLVVRLGGDEFAIVQIGADQPSQARILAHRLIEVLGQPFNLDGQQALIGVSVGIALGQLGADSDLLLKNADLALYQAKADGRGNCCMFRPELREVVQTRGALEADLRDALLEHQFELFFQPLLNAQTEALCGFEALLRWRHPVRGLVSPANFIPLAEEIGLIVPLGEWALNEACRQATMWPNTTKVAVNLSAVQFESDVVTLIRRALALSGLEPNRLELEITETVLLKNTAATLQTLHALHVLGVRIAMDDFGTGYSSLSYLRSFPFDKIKIDRSFMRDFGQEPDALAIIRAIIYLARELRISVTAEGVETLEQLVRLRAEGCDEVQGFLFSAPMPATELTTLFALFSNANGYGNPNEPRRSGVEARLQIEDCNDTSKFVMT